MKDAQKKIEEMAKEVYVNSNYSEVLSEEIARYIVKNDYRKIHEDDVVLPKDEYDYLKDMENRYDPFWFCTFGGCEGVCKECKDTCEMSIFVKERKKTAEQFAEMADKTIAKMQGEKDGYEGYQIDNKTQYDGYIVSLALFEVCNKIIGEIK